MWLFLVAIACGFGYLSFQPRTIHFHNISSICNFNWMPHTLIPSNSRQRSAFLAGVRVWWWTKNRAVRDSCVGARAPGMSVVRPADRNRNSRSQSDAGRGSPTPHNHKSFKRTQNTRRVRPCTHESRTRRFLLYHKLPDNRCRQMGSASATNQESFWSPKIVNAGFLFNVHSSMYYHTHTGAAKTKQQ